MDSPRYEIIRSYARTVQVKQYEPENFFASHRHMFTEQPTEAEIRAKSEELYKLAQHDVELAIAARLGAAEKEVNGEDAPY